MFRQSTFGTICVDIIATQKEARAVQGKLENREEGGPQQIYQSVVQRTTSTATAHKDLLEANARRNEERRDGAKNDL